MLTFEALYKEHWKYVYDLLPAYGIFGAWHDDVAQDVWYAVHVNLPTYNAAEGTPRAWITGIVRNCAADHRRRRRRRRETVGLADDLLAAASAHRESATELAGSTLRGRGPLNPEEQALIFWTLRQALEGDQDFEAFVLAYFHGRSYAEIATIQGVSKRQVEHRIDMAKKRLRRDDEASGAFLGFGTLEALVEAMQPPDQPDSRGAELWRRVQARIGGAPLPMPGLPGAAPGHLLLSKPLLAGLLAGTFLGGGGAGAGAVLLLQHMSAARVAAVHVAADPAPATSPALASSGWPAPLDGAPPPVDDVRPPQEEGSVDTASHAPAAAPAPASSSASPSTRPAVRPDPAPSTAERSPGVAPHEDADSLSSEILLRQIRAAARHGNCPRVLELVNEHAQKYPQLDVSAREAERARCR